MTIQPWVGKIPGWGRDETQNEGKVEYRFIAYIGEYSRIEEG